MKDNEAETEEQKKMKMKKTVVDCEDATWCAVNGWAAAMWVGDDAESQSHAHYPQTQRHTRHGTIYTKAQRNVILDVESSKSRKQDEEEERQELEALRKTRRLLSTLDTYVVICCQGKKSKGFGIAFYRILSSTNDFLFNEVIYICIDVFLLIGWNFQAKMFSVVARLCGSYFFKWNFI